MTNDRADAAAVVDVTVERERGLTIAWSDGFQGTIDLETLRAACPCAACRDRREQGREVWAPGTGGLRILAAELVGAWGISVRWQDGHDTGIYPWDSLRRWLDATDR